MASIVLPSGQRISLNQGTVTVGRLPECTISVNDSNISRQHAEMRQAGGGLRRGRPRLDERHARQRRSGSPVEQRLNDGDIISFGSTHVRFEAS